MFSYYSSIIAISCIANVVLMCLVLDNNRFSKETKSSFIKTCIFLILAAVSEWAGIFLNEAASWTIWIHKFAKACDYIFSPLFAFYLVKQLSPNRKLLNFLHIVQIANVVFAFVSIFTGLFFYVDATNIYHHGPLYHLYVAFYITTYLVTLLTFYFYAKKFKKQNLFSLIMIFLVIIAGLLVQEIWDKTFRLTYLSISFGVILLYVHYSEFYAQRNDDILSQKDILLRTDPLTNMNNRYAYNEIIQKYADSKSLDTNCVAFSVDINGLKYFNDQFGHSAGDELICGVAQILQKVFGSKGSCYKTGGDEFICIANMKKNEISHTKEKIAELSASWKGTHGSKMFLAVGYARSCEHPECNLEKLIIIADKMMYQKKVIFHHENPMYNRS